MLGKMLGEIDEDPFRAQLACSDCGSEEMIEMGTRRRFGCVYPKPNKRKPTCLEASYAVPVWAYEKYADVLEGKKRLSQRFQFDPKDPEDRRQAEADADAWLTKAEREINRGTWQPPKREKAKDLARSITFGQYATAYVENRRQRGKRGADPIDDTTKAKYRQYLDDYLLPQLGKLPMAAISEATLWRFVQTFPIGADGRGKSIRWHVVTLLRGIFREAATCKLDETGEPLLKTNPAEGVEVERSEPKEPYVDIAMKELEILAGAMPRRHMPIVYLAGVMGMRPEEVYALQRRDLEFSDDGMECRIHIRRARKEGKNSDGSKHVGIMEYDPTGKTKTKKSRRVLDVPPFLVPILRRHLAEFVLDRPESWLFTGERTRDIVQPQSVRNAWYQARKSVPRLAEKKVRLYDLRHRALTMMAGYTNNLKVVMAAGGHTQVSTAMHYQHATAGEELKVRQGIEAEYAATKPTTGKRADPSSDKPVEKPASAGSSELEALAGTLENMTLEARITVLKSLEAGKRARVLECFTPAGRIETMTELLKEIA